MPTNHRLHANFLELLWTFLIHISLSSQLPFTEDFEDAEDSKDWRRSSHVRHTPYAFSGFHAKTLRLSRSVLNGVCERFQTDSGKIAPKATLLGAGELVKETFGWFKKQFQLISVWTVYLVRLTEWKRRASLSPVWQEHSRLYKSIMIRKVFTAKWTRFLRRASIERLHLIVSLINWRNLAESIWPDKFSCKSFGFPFSSELCGSGCGLAGYLADYLIEYMACTHAEAHADKRSTAVFGSVILAVCNQQRSW